MALAYTEAVRNSRLQDIADAINAGVGGGRLRIYNGTRPATGGASTTLLAELTFSDPCELSITGGVLTFDTITADSSANADGTATWFRLVDASGVFVADGDVGTSGTDLNLNSTAIAIGQTVSVTSFTITEGNA